MTSRRKVRNVSKRFAKASEDSLDKDGNSGAKGKGRKRKLSDMLGHQWTKEELEQFYEAYRKYGKDWKKVAGTIRNRSLEMVEALYNMNKAYLSLADGVATAAGLIAMMTDHYNILEGSDSDRESNDRVKAPIKPQKRGRGKVRGNSSKGTSGLYPDLLHCHSPSSYGFLSLSKRKRSGDFTYGQPRAVGKRTPRFPVSYASDRIDGNKTLSPKRHGFKMRNENGSDDEGAHVAALALAEACQRGGSPQHAEPEITNSKFKMDDEFTEGSLGSREAENEDFIKDSSHPADSDSAGTITTKRNARKVKGKQPKFDDAKEACSGTEEGLDSMSVKDEVDTGLTNQQGTPSSSHGPRKRSRQLFFGDESTALDALQTLADLSLNMHFPSSAVESEASAQVKEEKRNTDVEKLSIAERMSKMRDKIKHGSFKSPSVGDDVVKRNNSKYRKTTGLDVNAASEANQDEDQSTSKTQRRKRKSLALKASKTEVMDSCGDKAVEVSNEEEKKSGSRAKRAFQFIPPPKHVKSSKPADLSSNAEVGNIAMETAHVVPHVSNEVYLPKVKSKRKMSLYKALAPKEGKCSDSAREDCVNKQATNVRTVNLKEKLSHCLITPPLRRWCIFEWFYSAIDYPWFAKSEFVEYLDHVHMGHVPRLTRVEWGVIRSSLGKPRRLSQRFLQEEREKLEEYRESVRAHYTELRTGIKEGLPPDLARPLSVGQRVTACHPKTREIHDGSVLTVDRDRCRIQFDRPELGVEFVKDIDCMPLSPLENMPDALRKRYLMADRFYEVFKESLPYGNIQEWKVGSSIPSRDNMMTIDGSPHCSADYHMNTLMKHAKGDTVDAIVQARAAANEVAVATRQAMYTQPCSLAQIQAKENDIRALAEMMRALNKKEALLIELRHMNEEVSSKQQEGGFIKDLENFRKQYAMLLLQLRDANDLVASALSYLRQRNTFNGNSTPPRMRTVENSPGPAGPPRFGEASLPNRDPGSHIVKVVETSRHKAKTMVNVAMQALSSVKEGEDAFVRVGEALDSTRKNQSVADTGTPTIKPFHSNERGQDNSACNGQASSCLTEPATANDTHDQKINKLPNGNETQFPSELISSCVSTMLMIQTCAEGAHQPAEAAQILESAVTSLLPCCSENLPIYREIEVCMGIIKNQMLALIPTPNTTPATEHPAVV